MKTVRLFSIAATCMALAGCSLIQPGVARTGSPFLDCNPGNVCKVTVTVVSCNRIELDYWIVNVRADHANMEIQWEVDGGSFGANAITFLDPAYSGAQFHSGAADSGNGRIYRIKNRHTAKGAHKYSIDIDVGGRTCRVDPIIVNN